MTQVQVLVQEDCRGVSGSCIQLYPVTLEADSNEEDGKNEDGKNEDRKNEDGKNEELNKF